MCADYLSLKAKNMSVRIVEQGESQSLPPTEANIDSRASLDPEATARGNSQPLNTIQEENEDVAVTQQSGARLAV